MRKKVINVSSGHWTQEETTRYKNTLLSMMAQNNGYVDWDKIKKAFYPRGDGSLYSKAEHLGIKIKKPFDKKPNTPEPLVIIPNSDELHHADGSRLDYFGK